MNRKSNYATMKNKKEKDKNKQKSEKTRDLLTEIRKNEENKYKNILSKK